MRIEDYPPQEPLPDLARDFHQRMMELGEGIEGEEHSFGDDPSQSLAVYPCATPASPVLIFMHGGGWTNGYKEQMAFLAPAFNARGFTFISSSYRLAPAHVFPANFNDAADSVKLVWTLADRYGYDREALFVGGHSSGGHLASLLATRTDWQAPRRLRSDVITGCAPISATFDFTPGSGGSVRPRFLGAQHVFNEVSASPLFHIGVDVPPFFVTCGSEDFPHLIVQAEKFAMVARARGGHVESLSVEGATHVTVLLTAPGDQNPWLGLATDWMRRIRDKAAAKVSP